MTRQTKTRRHFFLRPLVLESLETRAVPATLAHMAELHLGSGIDTYDVVHSSAGMFVAGIHSEQSQFLHLNEQGARVGATTLRPVAGYESVVISNLSEDGRWALGTSFTRMFDDNTGFVDYRSVITLWRLSDLSSPIALPSTVDGAPLYAMTDLSNLGTFAARTEDGRLFLVGPTGIQELSFPAGSPSKESGGNRFSYYSDITPDGRVFVGSLRVLPPAPPSVNTSTVEIIGVEASGDPVPIPIERYSYWDHYQAAVWRDGQPSLLEVDPAYASSAANSISDDGRLIGGNVLAEEAGHIAAVWFDGQFRTLKNTSGDPMRGNVLHVINGIDGDPTHWLAFGTSYQHNFGEVTFVADQSGVARPLSQWLHENYGLQTDLHAVALTDVLLADGRLRLFSSRDGVEPWSIHDNPLIGAPQILVRTGTQMITVDLQGERPTEDSALDVNQDGRVSPVDAVLVVNALNARVAASGSSMGLVPIGEVLDVNRDGKLAPIDAVLIINYINAHPAQQPTTSDSSAAVSAESQPEGESSTTLDDEILSLLADDLYTESMAQRKRSALQ